MKQKILCGGVLLTMGFIIFTLLTPLTQSSVSKVESNGTPAGWTVDINLSKNPISDMNPNIVINSSIIHMTWEHWFGGTLETFYMNSFDAGQTWNDIVKISNSGVAAFYPDIGNDENQVHIVWQDWKTIDWEIFYRNSSDSGETWNPEKIISSNDGYASEGPKVAASSNGQDIHVIWVDSRHGAESVPPNTEIYYNRSLDGGITWEGEQRLTNALYGTSGINIAVEESNIHIIFYDERDGSWDVYYKRSIDNGATWDDGLGNIGQDRKVTPNDAVDHGPATITVCDSLIHVVWVDQVWPGPVYYMYYRNSTDNGFSWNSIQLLSGPSPIISNPDITAWGANVSVVWADTRDDGSTSEVYYKNSTNSGISWNPDLRLTYNEGNDSWQPRIALNNSTVHVAWHDGRDSNYEIYYKRSPNFPKAHLNLTLNQGWNLISFPVLQPKVNGTPILKASDFSNITNCTELAIWNATFQNYTIYIPGFNLPTDPENFAIGEDDAVLIWWNETYNGTFNLSGYIPGQRNVSLKSGWNIVAYKDLKVGDVQTLWAPQVSAGAYDDICWFDGQTFVHYIYPGTEMQLVPTRGYFVWSDVDIWLIY